MDIISLLFLIFLSLAFFLLIFLILFKINKNSKKEENHLSSSNEDEKKNLPQKEEKSLYKAVVLCSPNRKFNKEVFDYKGQKDCRLFVSMYEGVYNCLWGCIGFGNCKKRCPRNAISIINSTAFVQKSCIGCGLCVDSCPQQLIKLIPFNTSEYLTCSYPEGNNSACSECNKIQKLNLSSSNDFKFWKRLYKMIHGHL